MFKNLGIMHWHPTNLRKRIRKWVGNANSTWIGTANGRETTVVICFVADVVAQNDATGFFIGIVLELVNHVGLLVSLMSVDWLLERHDNIPGLIRWKMRSLFESKGTPGLLDGIHFMEAEGAQSIVRTVEVINYMPSNSSTNICMRIIIHFIKKPNEAFLCLVRWDSFKHGLFWDRLPDVLRYRLDSRVILALRELVLHLGEWVALATVLALILYLIVLELIHFNQEVIHYLGSV